MSVSYAARKDFKQLRFVCDTINSRFSDLYAWFTPYEDNGIDIHIYNYATQKEYLFEVKTFKGKNYEKIKNSYWSTGSVRGDSWKNCPVTYTQEQIRESTEPMPDFGDTPVTFINSANQYGNTDKQKEHTLLANNAGIIFLAKDGILFFNPSEFKESIIGHAWNLQHSKEEYGKNKQERNCDDRVYEYKAIIDMNKGSFLPLNNVPDNLFEYANQSRNSRHLS